MFDIFKSPFNSAKLKSRLKMTAGRLDIDAAKKTALMKQNMRNVAQLLAESPPQEAKARLRAEALIRDDNTVAAYDILKLECLLLSERVSLIDHCNECPADLVSTVSDLIYAAPRLEIQELSSVRKQFRKKYGRTFKMNAMNNEGGILNEKIVGYLTLQTPTKDTVNRYMETICKQYDVDWSPVIELKDQQVIPPTPMPEFYVTTGLEDDRKMRNLESLDVLPPPPANTMAVNNSNKQENHHHDASSVTSSSSGSSSPRGGGGGGDGGSASGSVPAAATAGEGPMVVAVPYKSKEWYSSPDNDCIVAPAHPEPKSPGGSDPKSPPGGTYLKNNIHHVSCF